MSKEIPQLNSRFSFTILKEYYLAFVKSENALLKHMDYLSNHEIPSLDQRQKEANIIQEKPFDPFFMANPLVMKASKHAVPVIVFAAFYLESCIYNFALSYVSNTYFNNYLERLPLKAKFVIIPRLATGNSFECDSKAFRMLSELIGIRNKIAHPRQEHKQGKDGGFSEEEKKEFYSLCEGAHLAYKTVEEVLVELAKIKSNGNVSQHQDNIRKVFRVTESDISGE